MTPTVRLRHIAEVNPATPEFDHLRDDALVTFLPLEAVWPGSSLDISRVRSRGEVASGYTRFRTGDILIPKITPTFQANRTVLVSGLLDGVGVGTTELHVVRPGPRVDPRYLLYSLSSQPFLQEGEASMIGVAGQKRVPDDCVRDLPVLLRPIADQQAVAEYLDTETARLDALLVAEQRRAALSVGRVTALTETLVLGRPLRGDVVNEPAGPLMPPPAGWTVRRNKTYLHEVVDLSATGEEELLTVSHLTGITPRSDKDVTMFLAESNEGYKRVRPGDLVINTMWAWMGALGVSAHEGIVSPAYGVYRFTDPDMEPLYFDALFRSRAYVVEMTRHSRGVWTSRLRLYPESFLDIRSPVPHPAEQRRIADAVTELGAERDHLIRVLERSIELLLERRQALITAAVSGQLDIPGVAA
jgi:type I restriction enzyme S subunit